MTRVFRHLLSSLRHNFFALPAAAVIVAAITALLVPDVETGLWTEATVGSARAVMTAVAGATIAFASIAFSVSLLMIQQGSSQFSPRVVGHLTRDSFNRRVIAIVLATFAFCLVSLTRIKDPEDVTGAGLVPQLSVTIAIVAGIIAVLAVVAGLHHTSQQLDISRILELIVDHTHTALDRASGRNGAERSDANTDGRLLATNVPPGPNTSIRSDRDGWVSDLDRDALISAVPSGSVVRLETFPGRYVVQGAVLCRIWPPVEDRDVDDVVSSARRAVSIGQTRTMDDDTLYGVRQLVDIALRALSTGVNDPTTARDSIVHLGSLVVAHLRTGLPAAVHRRDADDDDDADGGGLLLLPHAPTVPMLADLAIAELRRAGADDPAVTMALLDMIGDIIDAARGEGLESCVGPFVTQADRILEQTEPAAWLDHERAGVVRAHAEAVARGRAVSSADVAGTSRG